MSLALMDSHNPTVQTLQRKNKQLRAEINEQARLLGISAEKELALMAKVEQLKKELKAINAALDDPRVDLTMTATEIIAEMKRDAERYRFLRQLDAKGIQVYDGNNDTSIFGYDLDAAIDAAMKGK